MDENTQVNIFVRNISNTRHRVSSHIKHREESRKYDAKRSIFNELRSF